MASEIKLSGTCKGRTMYKTFLSHKTKGPIIMLHMYKNPNILVSEKQITQFVEKQAKDLNRHFTTQATRWLTSM